MAASQGGGVARQTNEITQVVVSAPGATGKSAYQVWLDLGNVGTVAEYLNSLKVKGDKGDTGNQGLPGQFVEYYAMFANQAFTTNAQPQAGNEAIKTNGFFDI